MFDSVHCIHMQSSRDSVTCNEAELAKQYCYYSGMLGFQSRLRLSCARPVVPKLWGMLP